MALMRRRKTMSVYPATEVVGSAGQAEFTTATRPVKVRCNVRPLDTEEIQFWGDRGKDMRKLFADSWPGSMDARLEMDGARWDQVSPEQVFDYGSSTQHVEVTIRKR